MDGLNYTQRPSDGSARPKRRKNAERDPSVGAFLSDASFWFPDHLLPTAWAEHAPFAFWIVDVLRPRRLVELGTHHGYSYLTFCQAIERLGVPTECYAIDTWKGDEHSGFYDGEVLENLRNIHDERFGAFSRLLETTFDDGLQYFTEGSIDILHIDGRHFYEDVKHDFESWRPKLSDRGVILLHDTNVRERNFGVREFWEELCETYSGFNFLHCNGLGVLGIGRNLPPAVSELLALKSDEARLKRTRDVYSRLGRGITDHIEARTTASRIAAVETQLVTLQGQREAELASLNASLARQAASVDELAGRLAELQRDVTHKQEEFGALSTEFSATQAALAGVRADFARAEAALSQSQANAVETQAALSVTRANLADTQSALSETRSNLEGTQAEFSRVQTALWQAQSQLASLHQPDRAPLDGPFRELRLMLFGRASFRSIAKRLIGIGNRPAPPPLEIPEELQAPFLRARGAASFGVQAQRSVLQAELFRAHTQVGIAAPSEIKFGAILQELARVVFQRSALRALPRRLLAARRRVLDVNAEIPKDYQELYLRINGSGLFDPKVYVGMHEDVRQHHYDGWRHFLTFGLQEGRSFATPEKLAQAIASAHDDFGRAETEIREEAARAYRFPTDDAALLRQHGIRIAVYSNSKGNFYMREVGELFVDGLRRMGLSVYERDENGKTDEVFDLRVFIAPHEFFFLGKGVNWVGQAGAANSVLFNVEQAQTPWFALAFRLLLQAPLVLDLNFQTAELLKRAGCNAVHFMPGFLDASPYTDAERNLSDVELLKGYEFAQQSYNWRERDNLADRPVDILFIGARTARRDDALKRLDALSDKHRFLCVYRPTTGPYIRSSRSKVPAERNWALSQRTKIVLNLHRDWVGYFEWSRMVLRGVWQGAAVVSDPGLPNPIFAAGTHFLEEDIRHLPELIQWLLETPDGRAELDAVRKAGYAQARGLGSMRVALTPVLRAFEQLLALPVAAYPVTARFAAPHDIQTQGAVQIQAQGVADG